MVVWNGVELGRIHTGLAKYWSCFRSSLWVLHHERHQCREYTIAEPLSNWGNFCFLNSWNGHWDAIQILSQAMTSTLLGKEAGRKIHVYPLETWHLGGPHEISWDQQESFGISKPAFLQVWTAPGWVIYPELKLTAVSTANPGYGLSDAQRETLKGVRKQNSKLITDSWKPFEFSTAVGRYTNFTIMLQTVTEAGSTLKL